jgi:cell division septation protein DedD
MKPQDYLKARQIVSDAYLVRFSEGIRVQYGAYDSNEAAQDLVNRLKRQGITATIRAPK